MCELAAVLRRRSCKLLIYISLLHMCLLPPPSASWAHPMFVHNHIHPNCMQCPFAWILLFSFAALALIHLSLEHVSPAIPTSALQVHAQAHPSKCMQLPHCVDSVAGHGPSNYLPPLTLLVSIYTLTTS